jgi:hypothetical protein
MYDFDDTLSALELWMYRYIQSSESGALSLDMVCSAYVQSTGEEEPDQDEIYAHLSANYLATADPHSGALIFRAAING